MSRLISLTEQDSYHLWEVPDLSTNTPIAFDGEAGKTIFDDSEGKKEYPDFVENSRSASGNESEILKSIESAEELNRQYSAQFHEIMQAMSHPLDRVNSAVEKELVELSVAIAKLILRREISEQPEYLLDLIQQAIKQLPAASLNTVVHLHPQDAEIIRKIFECSEKTQDWQMEENEALNQGGCHIISDTSFVDASIDSLVDRLAKEMLGSYSVTDFNETETHNVIQAEQ